jgi:hypothetical protein
MAPAENVASNVLKELRIAQRNGSTTQIAARMAHKPRFCPGVSSGSTTGCPYSLKVLIDSLSHLLKEDGNDYGYHYQVKYAHRRAAAEIEELNRNLGLWVLRECRKITLSRLHDRVAGEE